MAPQLRPRCSFPKNRFRLEWFDILLKEPLSIPLDQPTFTIGLKGNNTWNIPIEAFRVDELRRSMPPWDSPLMTLTYDLQTHSWSSERQQPRWSEWARLSATFPNVYPPDILIDQEYPSVPLEVGETLEILLRDDREIRGDEYGSFTVVLVDTYPSRGTGSSRSGQQLFTDRLSSLPNIPLAIIAGYLEPYDCVKSLCAISPAITRKLCQVGVSWPAICMLLFPEGTPSTVKSLESPLDCLRAAKLANEQAVTSFWLGEEHSWKEPEATSKLLLQRIRKFLCGAKLEDLHITPGWFDRRVIASMGVSIPLPPSTLKSLTVHRGEASAEQIFCIEFWHDFAWYGSAVQSGTEVSLRRTTTITCYECIRMDEARNANENDEDDEEDDGDDEEDDGDDEEDDGDDEEDDEDAPRRTGDPLEFPPMPNVTALSWLFCNCKGWIPFEAFPNLRRMHLDLLDFCNPDYSEEDRYELAAAELKQASFRHLKDVSFRAGLGCMSFLLEATAQAAPNVEWLKWEGDPEDLFPWRDFYAVVESLDGAETAFGNFPSLRRLQIVFRPHATGYVDMIMDFCLRMPSGVSCVVFENIKCPDPAEKDIQDAAGRLIAINKEVILEAADGSGVGRVTYPLTGPVDAGGLGALSYSLIVRNTSDM